MNIVVEAGAMNVDKTGMLLFDIKHDVINIEIPMAEDVEGGFDFLFDPFDFW